MGQFVETEGGWEAGREEEGRGNRWTRSSRTITTTIVANHDRFISPSLSSLSRRVFHIFRYSECWGKRAVLMLKILRCSSSDNQIQIWRCSERWTKKIKENCHYICVIYHIKTWNLSRQSRRQNFLWHYSIKIIGNCLICFLVLNWFFSIKFYQIVFY